MVTNIDRVALLDLRAAGDAQIIDVLPAAEYDASHIPGALSVPLKSLNADSVTHLNRSKPTVVY